MSIDIEQQELLSLTDAARVLQINGKRPHISSIWRWCRRGLNGVRLEYGRAGRRIVTTRTALTKFMNQLAEADRPPTPSKQPVQSAVHCTPVTNRVAIERAQKVLKDAGIS